MPDTNDDTAADTAADTATDNHTTGVRESIGTKIDTTLVPYALVCAAAAGFNHGAKKYAPYNYLKGLSKAALIGSIERHTWAIKAGADIDADSGLPHLCLLASSVAMLVESHTQEVILEDRDVDLPVPVKYDVEGVAKKFKKHADKGHAAHSHVPSTDPRGKV